MTYRFSCTLCGDCCWGDQVVRLNKEDLILMAQFKGFDRTSELFTQGLVEAIREESGWRPRIRFRTKPARFCPFLQNNITEEGTLQGLCSLHPLFKPLVCHLSPLGRSLDLQENTQEWKVIAPVEGCPGMGKGAARKVNQDLEKFQTRLANEKEFFQFLQNNSPQYTLISEAILGLFDYATERKS